ncbi:RNA helicase [Candidatus Nitrosopelagicus brevis]|uniref:DEAD/DEAH box helicase n=1 Tax=Candidatus Nitrosopelagicus brevis TaxID=1410606 RepID=A0A0A7V470_9ARCH|nr:DEAD/DEAH box helicase [Candidatus Nitrosopelagicus brevis]AJA92991.1 DEAD/DEAH box helicase [Candidatus Nitrosopelagicus brevis]PTL87797.1 RNA helicase [Candidatus Nitrosopelagicus brevis]
MKTFEELEINEDIMRSVKELGFTTPFPIQAEAIPVLLRGTDVIGQAHTGTGKTATFGIPMLQNILHGGGIQGLVIAPTRELAMQITEEIKKVGKYTKIKVVTVYGGQGIGVQLDALRRKPEIVVATPGRLIDHLDNGSIRTDDIKHVVLDEADVMLDMGFIEDIEYVLQKVPANRITSLFSATMPPEILRLSDKYLNNPKNILIDSDDLSGEGIDQSFLVIKDREKHKYLTDFINQNRGQVIVFCSTKIRTRNVARDLQKSRYKVVAIEGDMSQNKREYSMMKFRKNQADVLVATDVAARGIDVPKVGLVVNYDVPNQDMVYFHRIGRTARAGAKGRAITLVSYSSIADWKIIKKQIKSDLTDLNKKMGIEVHIPDPLKRDVGRRIAQPMRSGYGRRPSYGGRSRPSYGGRSRPSYGGGRSRDGPARDQYKRRSSARASYGRQGRDSKKKW